MDDGTIAGPPEQVLADLAHIQTQSQLLGLHLNPKKCEITTLGGNADTNERVVRKFHHQAEGIRITQLDNLLLLGAAIKEPGISMALEGKLIELKTMCENLKSIDSHDALFLLRHAFAIPKADAFTEKRTMCGQSSLREV